MFENLTDRLERSFKVLKGEGKISEINVAETLKEVRRALLDADVNYKVAKSFTDTVKGFGHGCAHKCETWTVDGETCARRTGSPYGWRYFRNSS